MGKETIQIILFILSVGVAIGTVFFMLGFGIEFSGFVFDVLRMWAGVE